MEIEEPFNIVREQSHLDLVTLEIDYFFERLPGRLEQVDYQGQRDQFESLAKMYEASRERPFFGVFALEHDDGEESELIRVGRYAIHSDERDLLVSEWESPAARRYVQLEREDNNVYHAAVEILNGRVISVTETNTDRAFRRRQRILQAKGERLQDIVEVIRPEQDDIVRLERDGGLVIQGGPGTGKTVVALQRLAYLLYQARKDSVVQQPVLIVGPTPSYVEYVRDFIPSLGHQNAVSLDIRSLCLRRLSEMERTQLIDLREERDGITISKNTTHVVRLMRGLIWEPGRAKNISATVSFHRRPPTTRYVTSEFILGVLSSLEKRFNSDEISYMGARRELHTEIVRKLLSDQPLREKSAGSRSLESRRDALLETWLLKIGLHSQLERQRWRQILDTPAGGRYKRGLAAVMADYYVADITAAIDAIADLGTLDTKVLREALELRGAPQKRGTVEDLEEDTAGTSEDLIDLKSIDADSVQAALESGRLAILDKIVNELLPIRDVLRVSEKICSGDEGAFTRILGSQGTDLFARFRSASTNRPGSNSYWWTTADLPIIAEVSFLINGNAPQDDFFHVVVDEAQDLTALQVRAIRRYVSNGNLTLAGDVNQATRPASVGNWERFFSELGIKDWEVHTLEHNYRVPENIYDYALTYLSEENRIETPSCDLEGGKITLLEVVDAELAEEVSQLLVQMSPGKERVAIICDDPEFISGQLHSQHENLVVLSAEDSKGLEVDHSIVLMPSRWFNGSERMKRLMYVVLTRATKSVTILQRDPENFGILIPQYE